MKKFKIDVDSMDDNELLGSSVIVKYLGISSDHWHALVARGKVPKPIQISARIYRWSAGTIKKLKKEFYNTGVLPVRRYHKPLDLNNKDVPDSYLATRRECALFLKVSMQTWTKLVKTGKAPKPAESSYSYPRWLVGDVREYFGKGGSDA